MYKDDLEAILDASSEKGQGLAAPKIVELRTAYAQAGNDKKQELRDALYHEMQHDSSYGALGYAKQAASFLRKGGSLASGGLVAGAIAKGVASSATPLATAYQLVEHVTKLPSIIGYAREVGGFRGYARALKVWGKDVLSAVIPVAGVIFDVAGDQVEDLNDERRLNNLAGRVLDVYKGDRVQESYKDGKVMKFPGSANERRAAFYVGRNAKQYAA